MVTVSSFFSTSVHVFCFFVFLRGTFSAKVVYSSVEIISSSGEKNDKPFTKLIIGMQNSSILLNLSCSCFQVHKNRFKLHNGEREREREAVHANCNHKMF